MHEFRHPALYDRLPVMFGPPMKLVNIQAPPGDTEWQS
jgi:hypothetical protein